MASAYGSDAQADMVRAAIAEVKGLTVDRLKKVLRTGNLQVSGVKNELQIRLIAYIERSAAQGDYTTVESIRNAVRGTVPSFANTSLSNNPYPSPYSNHTPTSSLSPQFNSPTPRPLPSMSQFMAGLPPQRLAFKNSPFYTVARALSPVHELKVREHTRDTVRISLRLDSTAIDSLQRDPNVSIMVFCAAESNAGRSEALDISFPQHGELKCNSSDIKHNMKGMKNRPGTTRPAEITQFVRRNPTYPNTVELTYALTTKKYFLVVNMVQKKPVQQLVNELKARRTPFLKDKVIGEMREKAEDPDIVATSSVMSLKDPLQMTRIQIPCRGVSCAHNACFDASAFLALQEQAPTWSCPHCSKPAPWDTLAFDHYFDDILRNTADAVEQVTVEPDGTWKVGQMDESNNNKSTRRNQSANDDYDDDDDDDDDIVEISDTKSTSFTNRTPPRQTSLPHAPTIPQLPPSTSSTPRLFIPPATPGQLSNKRKHQETIDLTLDDSDDEQPPSARIKRPSFTSSSSGNPLQNALLQQQQQHQPYQFSMPPPPSNLQNHTFPNQRFDRQF